MRIPKLPAISQLAPSDNKNTIVVTARFFAVAIAILALYSQDLSMVFNDALHSEASFHILAVPFIFGYLLYRKRNMVSASIPLSSTSKNFFQKNFSTITGIVLCATAFLAYWFGSYTFLPLEYHMLTLPIFAAGLILILFNPQTLRQLFFPIAFLIFLTPPPIEILYTAGATLSDLSAVASNGLASILGLHSTLAGNYGSPIITLTRPDQTVMNFSIDVACSGIYSLIGFVIFAVFIAYITRGKKRNKFAILLMGIPLIIALNIIRITTILVIGYNYGDEIALQIFHTVGATVLMFMGTLLLLAITEKVFKKPKPPEPCKNCNNFAKSNPTGNFCIDCGKLLKYPKIKLGKSDLAKIVGVALIVVMFVSIQVPIFALTQGPAQVLIQTPAGVEQGNTLILPEISGYALSYVYRDTSFEQILQQDVALVYSYRANDTAKPTVWVAVEVASTISNLHRWETCLVNYPLSQGLQPSVKQFDLRDIQTQENPPIVARFFAFQDLRSNQSQVVLYWYGTAMFTVNGTSQLKNVKMSLVVYPQSLENLSEIENNLLPFAAAINDYWQPIKTWTPIALAISQNGLVFSIVTSVLLVVLMLYSAFLRRQDKLFLVKLYTKLSEQDKLVVDAVGKAEKAGNPTTSRVIEEFQKLSRSPYSEVWLSTKLKEAQTAGLIKQTLMNSDNDTPTIVWRSCVIVENFFFELFRI